MTTMVASQEKLAVGMEQKDVSKAPAEVRRHFHKNRCTAATFIQANSSGAVLQLHAGGLLILDYKRPSASEPYRVSGMSLCMNSDEPKSRRVWKTAKQIKI